MSQQNPAAPSSAAPTDHAERESSAATLPKAYDPSAIEQRWADYWVNERLFEVLEPTAKTEVLEPTAKAVDDGTAAPGGVEPGPFTILLPPPNVTGRLHMGHMLNQTEMDILTRWHRMRGQTALWVPGTDHAGIATQMMVERQLASEGTDRKSLGRDAFTARVWQWKQQYGSAITDQMRRLGASVDWSREYFTMDDRLSVAVKEAFVRLYEQGLIYRGAYIVNWDPIQQTAVSDLEVESEERIGKLYAIRYPFAGASAPYDETNSIVIATTRPETMLGDVAVAVNPADPRYKHLIGTTLQLPLTGREIPILADDWAKPEFGTGAVKVTPAHDPNDFAIGRRHNLPSLTILDETARVSLPGSPYHGLDRFAARERIVNDLTDQGLLLTINDHPMTVPVSQRSGAVIEPRLSLQWFLAVNKSPDKSHEGSHPDPEHREGERPASPGAPRNSIAANAIAAVRDGHIKFTPEMYAKTYFEWMSNIHDWCISRQLWWGHRIPAWHCDQHHITVARDTPTACTTCGSATLTQSTDVLDTWFSSGLLPFTAFGWPGEGQTGSNAPTNDLAAFYPTSLLVTGFDILFFWVARMIMLGTHFMLDVPMPDGSPRPLAEAVPFREVYIHALVRDANREKMSKTKGNVIDPIEIVTKYGTDAVRFTLASQASPGTDIAFSEARTEGYRAFANKIWNAARFLFMNLDRAREAGLHIPLPAAPCSGSTCGPIAAGHSILGRLTDLIAASTPHGEAVMQTGNIDLANQSATSAPHATVPPASPAAEPLESRWIQTRLSETAAAVNASLAGYRFDEAASHIYQFFWGDLCDWYLEIVKLRLLFDDPAQAAATTAALTTFISVFESALRLLSPFMPFLTEEIWHALYAGHPPAHASGKRSIALTRFPQPQDYPTDPASVTAIQTLQELITTVRALRKELAVPEKEPTPIELHAPAATAQLAQSNVEMLSRLARVSAVQLASATLTGASARSTAAFDVAVLYERQIDVPAERERLTKELAKLDKLLTANDTRLADQTFLGKAPAHIVEGLRKQTEETRTLRDKTSAALAALPHA